VNWQNAAVRFEWNRGASRHGDAAKCRGKKKK